MPEEFKQTEGGVYSAEEMDELDRQLIAKELAEAEQKPQVVHDVQGYSSETSG